MAKKRSRLEIVIDVLDTLSKRATNPTKLATLVNMPYDRLMKLLEELTAKGIIQWEEQGRSQIITLTPQGHRLHEELRRVRKLLRDYGMID